jgi:hypothetical protein
VAKDLVGGRVAVDTVIAKYSSHLPLYRKSMMLEREAGVESNRARLDGDVMRVGELRVCHPARWARRFIARWPSGRS